MDRSFQAVEPRIPTLDELTELYKRATDSGSSELQAVAHRAVTHLAAAEAAAAEAATLADFAARTHR